MEEVFMLVAIREAKKAKYLGEKTTVGAVIVKNGQILSKAHNTAKHKNDPTCHAEINAIRQAATIMNSKNLLDCTLYVTLEPCIMCFGAIISAKITKVFFGSSLYDMAKAGHRDWKVNSSSLNQQFGNIVKLQGGLLNFECKQLL
jgi:tRNA(Arg) A34 adenosine deaminase TadA